MDCAFFPFSAFIKDLCELLLSVTDRITSVFFVLELLVMAGKHKAPRMPSIGLEAATPDCCGRNDQRTCCRGSCANAGHHCVSFLPLRWGNCTNVNPLVNPPLTQENQSPLESTIQPTANQSSLPMPSLDTLPSTRAASSSPLPGYPAVSQQPFTWGNLTGPEFTKLLDTIYEEVVHWRRNCFCVPPGKAGRNFILWVSSPDSTWPMVQHLQLPWRPLLCSPSCCHKYQASNQRRKSTFSVLKGNLQMYKLVQQWSGGTSKGRQSPTTTSPQIPISQGKLHFSPFICEPNVHREVQGCLGPNFKCSERVIAISERSYWPK